ncbi:hypothetical protein ABT160_46125 [Streptomyces sp. NPDC001941]|uniref:hypothetical protein n=1 Tax=Streptomyces sp. NPDC001941 TaxID=3154659 RepID=UPI0033217E59
MVTAPPASVVDVQQVLRTCAALLRAGQHAPLQEESEQTIRVMRGAFERMISELTDDRRRVPETANAIAEARGMVEASYLVSQTPQAWHFRAMGWARALRPIAVQYLDQVNEATPWAVGAAVRRPQ